MIMVVAQHCSWGGFSLLGNWFAYSGLDLALFAFSSGYFYKPDSENDPGKYISKKIRTLVIPYFVYTFVYGIIAQILKLNGFEMGDDISITSLLIIPIANGHEFVYNLGGWFVVPLFMIEILNVLFRRAVRTIRKDTDEWVFFAISVILGILGISLACAGYYFDGWLVLVRMLYFVPFYGLGILYRSKLEKIDKRIPSSWYFATVMSIDLVIIFWFGKALSYNVSWCYDFYEGPIMPIIVGFLGIAFWLRIATLLEPVIGRSKWINAIADNTYSIMMNQFIGFMIVKTIYALLNKYLALFPDFDWISYKNDIWYYYVPKGVKQTLILYVVAGICFSIAVQRAIDYAKERLSSVRENNS